MTRTFFEIPTLLFWKYLYYFKSSPSGFSFLQEDKIVKAFLKIVLFYPFIYIYTLVGKKAVNTLNKAGGAYARNTTAELMLCLTFSIYFSTSNRNEWMDLKGLFRILLWVVWLRKKMTLASYQTYQSLNRALTSIITQ